MLDGILERLRPRATQRNILLLLAVFLVINAGLLPMFGARLEALSGGIGPLDLRAAYTATEAYAALAAFGQEGRLLYLLMLVTVDVIYPAVSAAFFSLTILYCLEPVLPGGHVWQRAALLPWLNMLADWAENAGLSVLVLNYPHRLDGLATFTSTVTTIKWIFAFSAMAATAAALVAFLVQRVRARRAGSA